MLDKNPRGWHTLLKYAFWADRTTVKNSLRNSPYHLVYGIDPVLPVNLKIPMLKFIQEFIGFENKQEGQLVQLLNLDEKRDKANKCMNKHQAVVKRWFDE